MRTEDKARFGHILFGLCETFGKNCTEGLVDGYWLALSDLTPDEFAAPSAFLDNVRGGPVVAVIGEPRWH